MTSSIELRCGDWREVLADVGEVDAVISDPPYSERTHAGHDEGAASANRVSRTDEQRVRTFTRPNGKRDTGRVGKNRRRALGYDAWTAADVTAFVEAWAPRCRGWIVALTDHVLIPAWGAALENAGRYVFAPLQFMQVGSRVRLSGDGPALWSASIMVARPTTRTYARWGALPGGYVCPTGTHESKNNRPDERVIGGKPLWIMRALVRDYSRPGDLICDPCAGGATTLIAAATEGRRAIGAELDPKTYALAMKRIAKGYTPTLFDTALQPMAAATQSRMFDDE